VDLDSAARDLYALTPGEFTARRDALTREARDAGDKDLARQVNGLRKPAVAAWLVNQLATEGVAELQQLLDVGAQLRDAQADLAGRRMQELSRQRHQLVRSLTRTAGQIAADRGQPATAAVVQQVSETLGAAVADPQAAAAVSSGRLTRPLAYAGLGEVDVSAATATPLRLVGSPDQAASPAKAKVNVKAEPTPRADRLPELRAAARSAADDAAAAARQLQEATTSRDELSTRVEELQQSLAQSRYDLAAARSAADRAERGLRQAERAARMATRALQAADGSAPTS